MCVCNFQHGKGVGLSSSESYAATNSRIHKYVQGYTIFLFFWSHTHAIENCSFSNSRRRASFLISIICPFLSMGRLRRISNLQEWNPKDAYFRVIWSRETRHVSGARVRKIDHSFCNIASWEEQILSQTEWSVTETPSSSHCLPAWKVRVERVNLLWCIPLSLVRQVRARFDAFLQHYRKIERLCHREIKTRDTSIVIIVPYAMCYSLWPTLKAHGDPNIGNSNYNLWHY